MKSFVEKKKKLTITYKFKKFKYYIFSHHPKCENFKNDTFRLGSIDFCIGCFIGYPFGIIGAVLGYYTIFLQIINPLVLFLISFLMLSSIFLSFTDFTKKKTRKISQKILIGLGGGSFIGNVFFFFPGGLCLKILGSYFIFLLLNFPIQVLHYRNMDKTCDACEFNPGWNQCPGFQLDL
ncbi:MAG: hypothetical protein ACTSXY_15085 [Promethearchaeota archaeon]